jgi:cytochrome b561
MQNRYSFFVRHLHWIGGLVIVVTVIAGMLFEDAGSKDEKISLLFYHSSLGLLALFFAAFRLLARTSSTAPVALDSHTNLEKKLSKIVVVVLYAAMIALPITGTLAVWYKGITTSFFGLFELAPLVEANNGLHKAFENAHGIGINLLYIALSLHVLGALKHHFLDKDETLSRISPLQK